jgi:hypothetical protein
MRIVGKVFWRVVMLPFACAPLLLLMLGLVTLRDLDRKIDTYKPVQAVVLGTGIKANRGAKNSTYYTPEIRYYYFVNDRRYESERERWQHRSWRELRMEFPRAGGI